MNSKTLSQIVFTLGLCLMICLTQAKAQVSGGLPPLPTQPIQPQAQLPPLDSIAVPIPDKLVRTLQESLNQEGFNAGLADGFWGPQTEAAIRSAERASGLPITGLPTSALATFLNRHTGSTESTEASLLEDRRTLDYLGRLDKYRRGVGRSIPVYVATLSGELSSPVFEFPQLANRIEKSQTWWDDAQNVKMVFHNSSGKSLDGLVLKITARGCNSGENDSFRFITFASDVKPGRVVAAHFPWDADLPTGRRCIDVVDVIFK